jgi:hypothetical protein
MLIVKYNLNVTLIYNVAKNGYSKCPKPIYVSCSIQMCSIQWKDSRGQVGSTITSSTN